MNPLVVICAGLIVCSSSLCAGEFASTDYSTLLSFNKNERISLGGVGNGGWYFSPYVGYNLISNTATQGLTINFAEGIAFGGGFGVEIKPDLVFQFDFGYMRNKIDRITNDGTGVISMPDIEYTQIPLMLNLIWSPSNQPDLQPYFGLGIGAVRGEYESNAFIRSDAEWAYAGQVRLGLQVDLSTTSNLTFGYQFTLAQYDDDIDNHTLVLGLHFQF